LIDFHHSPRFILRENLGKLARLLRFLGYDAALYRHLSFTNLCRIAAREKRLVLTRSRIEANKKTECRKILIISPQPVQQLLEIMPLLEFSEQQIFSRCSLCNKLLYEIEKEKINSLVPEYVYAHNTQFRLCRHCGHIYWVGDHYRALYERLKNLFEEGMQ
jgi:uncharacterized protein